MTSAAALSYNSLRVVRYDLIMTITEPKEFPTIVQITAKHAISIYGEQIFDSNFHEPMQLNKDNLTRCCKNVSDEGFLGVIRGYIFSDDQAKSRKFGKPIKKVKPVKPIKQVKTIKKIKSIKEVVREMENTIKIRALKCLSSAFEYFAKTINHQDHRQYGLIGDDMAREMKCAQEIKLYKNASCTISNLNITDKSDPFHLLFKVLEKKPHLLQVSMHPSKQTKYNSSKGNLVFQGKNCRNFNSVPTLCLISTPRIEDNNEEYDLIVLTQDQMFIEGFEEGIEDTDKNLQKYQSQKKYLDHGRTKVLKSCSFYSKDLYKQRLGFNPFQIMRENRELAFKLRREW